MIRKVHPEWYELVCDICGEESAEVFTDFYAAVEWKKDRDNGWRSMKNDLDEWEDVCPECLKEMGG